MDPLADLLGRARASGSLFAETRLHGRGGLALGAEPVPLSLHVVREGSLWLRAEGRTAALAPGDVVLVRAGVPVAFCTGPDEPATSLAALLAGRPPAAGVDRLELAGPGERAVLLCGAYALSGSVCDRLLEALPAVAHVRAVPGPMTSVVQVVCDELDGTAPGQQTALDCLLDLLLVHVLRAHFASGAAVPAWYSALGDPVVGEALRALHGDPAAPWTVEALARRVGLSRAALARRFTAARRRAAAGLPHRLAHRAGQGGAPARRQHPRLRRPGGGLRQRVRAVGRVPPHGRGGAGPLARADTRRLTASQRA